MRLPPADDRHLGRRQNIRPLPLIQRAQHHPELRVRQDAGQREQRGRRITQPGSQDLVRRARRERRPGRRIARKQPQWIRWRRRRGAAK